MEKKVQLEQEKTLSADPIDQLKSRMTCLSGNKLDTTSFDGTLVWAITDFSRRRQEAINGRTPSIYSTPFYTSRAGYKMCARINLNGDGMGLGTHISLSFVIMNGGNDAFLPWPFKGKVTLMLVDQNNREHVIDTFRPNTSNRPGDIVGENVLFLPLPKLDLSESRNAYVKEDTMIIRCWVNEYDEHTTLMAANLQDQGERLMLLEKSVVCGSAELAKREEKRKVSTMEIIQQVATKKTFVITNVSDKNTMMYLGDVNTDIQGEAYTLAVYFYPNGVGPSTGQGVAVGVAMKKSPLDSVLPWPFSGKIIISLPPHDVEKCITPDRCLDGSRWERPQNDINEQYIIENFCPLDVLHNCEDDTALVRIAFEKFM